MAERFVQQNRQSYSTYQNNNDSQNWRDSNNLNKNGSGYRNPQDGDYNYRDYGRNNYDARNEQSHDQPPMNDYQENLHRKYNVSDEVHDVQQKVQQLNIDDNRIHNSRQKYHQTNQSRNFNHQHFSMQPSKNNNYSPDEIRTYNEGSRDGGVSRAPFQPQQNPPLQSEEFKPRVLAKKTNDANPVAMFGVVAKVDQGLQYSAPHDNVPHQDMQQRSPVGPQSPRSWQTSQQNNQNQSSEPNRNRRPPIPRKPQIGPAAQHNRSQNFESSNRQQASYRDDSSGYGSGYTEGASENHRNPHPQSHLAQEAHDRAISASSVHHGQPEPLQPKKISSHQQNNGLTRHWTLRKPSQGDEDSGQADFAVDETQSRSVHSMKQQFDQGPNRRPPPSSNMPPLNTRFPPDIAPPSSFDDGYQRPYGNARPVPPRPNISSSHQEEGYGPPPNRNKDYQDENRLWPREQQHFSRGPQSPQHYSPKQPHFPEPQSYQQPQIASHPQTTQYNLHSPNNPYEANRPPRYDDQQPDPRNPRHGTPYYESGAQPGYERTSDIPHQVSQHQPHYYEDGRKLPQNQYDRPRDDQYNDNIRLNNDGLPPSSQGNYARDQQQDFTHNQYDNRSGGSSHPNYPPGPPFQHSERSYDNRGDAPSLASRQIPSHQRELHYEQRPRNQAQEVESERNYVPDVVSRSYQISEQHSEQVQVRQTIQHASNDPRNLSASEEPPNQPEPQTRQIPMGEVSKRPPPLTHVPRHPFDPVEDDTSSENNVDDSPPPVSKPSGWSHRKIGGFSYLGTLAQSNSASGKAVDKPRRKEKQQNLRQPGDGLNSDESPADPTLDEPSPVLLSEGSDVQPFPLNHNHSKDRLRLAKEGRAKRRPPTRSFSSERQIQQDVTAGKTSPDFEINVTANDLALSRTSPITVQKSKVTKNKPGQAKKVKPSKPKTKQRLTDETTQTSTAAAKPHDKFEKKFVFKVPSENALKRETAHPVPCTKRVPVIEGFGNTPKTKHTFGSGLIGQIKSVGEHALRPAVAKKGDHVKPRPPPKPSVDEIRIEKNTEAILKSIEMVDESREEKHHEHSRQRLNDRGRSRSRDRSFSPVGRGRSRSLDRLSSSPRRGRSRSCERLSSSHRRGRSRSRDRLSSPNRRGRSRSRDRLSSPNRRDRSRSRDRLSSPNRRGRSRSRDRLSSPNRRGRSRSRDRLSSPNRRGRSRSRDRLSSPYRKGRSKSRGRPSSPPRRGRSRSRDRLSNPSYHGRSKSRGRLSSPHRRGRSRSRDRLSSPSRRGRSKSHGRLSSPPRRARTRSRDRLSGPSRRGRSYSRERNVTPEHGWGRENLYRKSERHYRFAPDYSPHRSSSYGKSDPFLSHYGGDLAHSRRNRPSGGGNVTKRAWVNDPRWRQKKEPQFNPRDRDFRPDENIERQQMFPSKLMTKGYSPPYASRNPHYNRR